MRSAVLAEEVGQLQVVEGRAGPPGEFAKDGGGRGLAVAVLGAVAGLDRIRIGHAFRWGAAQTQPGRELLGQDDVAGGVASVDAGDVDDAVYAGQRLAEEGGAGQGASVDDRGFGEADRSGED